MLSYVKILQIWSLVIVDIFSWIDVSKEPEQWDL